MSRRIDIRVGIPGASGSLHKHAKRMGYKILVSANSFWRQSGGFRKPNGVYDGMDVALDSAGFVAMVTYGGYRWSHSEYFGLARSRPWAWWASMDYCCEPQVADDAGEVARRVDDTHSSYLILDSLARAHGAPSPMPVLQGWHPSDYLRSISLYDSLPDLVGVGSVCRRTLNGPSGLHAVLSAIDAALPPRIGLHLFGVKGEALAAPWMPSRVVSIDSMAWDYGARVKCREAGVSFSTARRIEHMDRWYSDQSFLRSKPQPQIDLFWDSQ